VQQLINCLHSWDALCWRPSQQLKQAVPVALARLAPAVALATTESGAEELVGLFHVCSLDSWRSSVADSMQGERPAVQAGLRRALLAQLPRIKSARSVFSTLQTWAELGGPFDEQLSAAASDALQKNAASMSRKSLLDALALLEHTEWCLSVPAQRELQRRMVLELHAGPNPRAVSKMVQACTQLDWRIGHLALKQAVDTALEWKASKMKTGQLAGTIGALGRRGWQPSAKACKQLREALLERVLNMTAVQLALTLDGWIRLGWELDGELRVKVDAALARWHVHA